VSNNTLVATAQFPWLVSTSQLKEWDKCKKQFYYKSVLKTQWLSTQKNFELGKAVHKLMDYQARNLPLEPILTEVRQDIQETYLALEAHSLAQAKVIANEWRFNIPFPLGMPEEQSLVIWLTGRVDRLVETWVNTPVKQPVYWVVDWKTGTAVPPDFKQAWQTRLYLYAIWEARHQLGMPQTMTFDQLGFVYAEVKPKRKQAVRLYEVIYSEAQHQQTHANLAQSLRAMLQEYRFDLPATCPDSYCPFASICGIAPVETEQLNLLALPEKPVRKRKKAKKEMNRSAVAITLPRQESVADVGVSTSPFDWF
jgi:DNA-binding transcriptional regulator/RsmH inhibitor MraZ